MAIATSHVQGASFHLDKLVTLQLASMSG